MSATSPVVRSYGLKGRDRKKKLNVWKWKLSVIKLYSSDIWDDAEKYEEVLNESEFKSQSSEW